MQKRADNDPKTGAQSNLPELRGTETLVEVSRTSLFYLIGIDSLAFACALTHRMFSYLSYFGSFRTNGIVGKSMGKNPLLKSGEQGLEIALPLNGIPLKLSGTFTPVVKENGEGGHSHRAEM